MVMVIHGDLVIEIFNGETKQQAAPHRGGGGGGSAVATMGYDIAYSC